jgi:hypothetical protein
MPIARITVVNVSDQGDTVTVWGQPEHAPIANDPVGYVFQAKGEDGDAGLAERASRLGSGDQVVIDFSGVVAGWNLARGLSGS